MDTSILDPWPLSGGILKAAVQEALKSDYKFKLGSVIFKGKRIISVGHNQIRSVSAVTDDKRKWSNSLHSELAAILRGPNYRIYKGASIFIVKVSKTEHSFSNARPCEYCMASLEYVGIKKIYFTNEQGEISYECI